MDKGREYVLGMYEKSMPKDISWIENLLASKESS